MITSWLPGITRHKNIVRPASLALSMSMILSEQEVEPLTP
jgi:hypothetical protein